MDCGFFCSRFCIWENSLRTSHNSLTLHEFSNGLHYARDLIFSQFREHRQRKNLLRGTLSMWKVPGFVAQVCVQRLQV